MPPVVDVSAMTLTPDSEGANNTKLKIVEEFLRENPSIQYIRFQWLDYTGVATCRVVTKSYCLKLAKENGSLHLPSPMLTTISLDTSIAFEDIEAGEDQIWPDWSTLVPCYYQSGHAQVMCFVEEGGATGSGFLRCPRYRLKDLLSKAKAAYNLEFLVGLEIEFYILPSKDGTNPIEMVHNAFSTASLRNPCLPIVEEIVSSVSKAGFEVRQFHSEGAPGLFEFSLEPLRPLRAADALVYSHEAIKSICVKHGLYGTVHPKPFEKLSSAGSHIHLSISQVDKADKFLAGLLDSFCALAAFYMPNFDSHTRLRPGSWVYWGTQNKAAPIKKVADGYWELRTPDGTMNPYLTLLAILTAGILGIKNEMELTVKDSNKFAMTIDEKEVEEKCIKHKLPTSLMGAITSLKEHTKLREALGEEIVEKYLKIKTKEADIFEKLTWSERREITTRIF